MTRKTRTTKKQPNTSTPSPTPASEPNGWYAMDLHLHTPASSDYQETNVAYLDILRRAEAQGLDIIAFTDHNTVAGYRRFREEIEELELLERLKRLLPEEKTRLAEYRRILSKRLVLPGFEFTATLGFHILGIFPPETSVRDIEYILLSLNIPSEKLDEGSATVGATADVLTAYKLIDEAGGLAIAAHVNSSNGVAMRGLNFGGQTKIAYTQDLHLHALEVTDLEDKGKRTTASFFNGTKAEYARHMHCVQGSDAHRLTRSAKNLGVGDRPTDVQLDEVSFVALKSLFLSNDFERVRPHRTAPDIDPIQMAREEGDSLTQAFHDTVTARKLAPLVTDACAFANAQGGTLYLGLTADPKKTPSGVAATALKELQTALKAITPSLAVDVETLTYKTKPIAKLRIAQADDAPYLFEGNIFIRKESETLRATREDIIEIVLRNHKPEMMLTPAEVAASSEAREIVSAPEVLGGDALASTVPPKTGVEVVASEKRSGRFFHTMRDLRNGSVVKNVTRSSARKLWHYAVSETESNKLDPSKLKWYGDIALWRQTQKFGVTRYDFVQRLSDGSLRIYYGVSDEGVHGPWKALITD